MKKATEIKEFNEIQMHRPYNRVKLLNIEAAEKPTSYFYIRHSFPWKRVISILKSIKQMNKRTEVAILTSYRFYFSRSTN